MSASFLFEPQNQAQRFPGLGLKTGNSVLVICASKSLRQFLDLDFKTKRASIFWLHHKIDKGRSMRDTRPDLATWFGMKQV
jgi:hypothetical protein